MSESGGGRSRVGGGVVRALASYLRRALGPERAAAVFAEAGLEVDPDDIGVDMRWYASRQVLAVVDRVEPELGGCDLGRRTGEEMFRLRPDIHPMFHSLGSVHQALKTVVNLGSRTRTEPAYVVIEEGPTHLVVRSTAPRSTRFACGAAAGHWAQVPTLFDSIGTVIERCCVVRGDPYCEFRIAWDPVEGADTEGYDASRRRSHALVLRFEELLQLAAELTAEDTTQGLLHKIAARAGSAVTAPMAVVAVRFSDDDELQLGWSGMDEEAARALAEQVAGGELDLAGDAPYAVVAIESVRRCYGFVVVGAQPGVSFTGNERRMLRAYAGHATAAIEAAAALEEATLQRDTAESLLGLARALSSLGSTDEIAQRIAEEVTSVVRCDLAVVVLLDADREHLHVAGSWPHAVDTLGIEQVRLEDVPAARTIIEDLEPAAIATADTDGLLHSLMQVAGMNELAAAPISIRGEVIGLVLAASADDHMTLGSDVALRRLAGLADHAASALDNSRLLERVQHQALHDPLTGLPNRTLIEDRVAHALAMAERGDRWVSLLFVDLDRFKEVNDELGHAAGDALLTQFAARLESCVRASDTVGRLGGDEFLILLENTCGDEDAARVAEKVVAAVQEPFDIGGRRACVSVSVGITSAPGRGVSYPELLARADAAMYRVKQRGRNGWSTFEVG